MKYSELLHHVANSFCRLKVGATQHSKQFLQTFAEFMNKFSINEHSPPCNWINKIWNHFLFERQSIANLILSLRKEKKTSKRAWNKLSSGMHRNYEFHFIKKIETIENNNHMLKKDWVNIAGRIHTTKVEQLNFKWLFTTLFRKYLLSSDRRRENKKKTMKNEWKQVVYLKKFRVWIPIVNISSTHSLTHVHTCNAPIQIGEPHLWRQQQWRFRFRIENWELVYQLCCGPVKSINHSSIFFYQRNLFLILNGFLVVVNFCSFISFVLYLEK